MSACPKGGVFSHLKGTPEDLRDEHKSGTLVGVYKNTNQFYLVLQSKQSKNAKSKIQKLSKNSKTKESLQEIPQKA